jgi:hypothetical protein
MLEVIQNSANKLQFNLIYTPPKHNRIWGTDYVLMDSSNFLGKTNGEEYEKIISMFSKLWSAYNYQLFSNLSL